MITTIYRPAGKYASAVLADNKGIWVNRVDIGVYEWYRQKLDGRWTLRIDISAINLAQAVRIAIATNTKVI